MDQGTAGNEEINPRETASIFSIITFFYNYQILKKGKVKDLEEKDVYQVMPAFESERLGDQLESQWKKDKKVKKRASIIGCLAKCFGWTYVMYGLIQLVVGTAIILLQPIVFSKFVAYFQPGQTTLTKKDAYLFGLSVIGLNLLNTIYTHNFQQLVAEYSMKVRTAVCSLIFRKSLKLSPMAFAEITVGKIITMMSKDVFSIDSSLSFLKDMVIGFLQIGAVTYIMYQKVGFSAFPAVAVILSVIPLQLFVGKKTTDCRLETSKATDERFRLLQETLSAIKIIKMYTWDNYFEKLIHAARLKETDRIKIVYYLKSFIVSFGGSTLNLAFYVLLISYIARGYTIQAETVYFVQQCLAALRVSITMSIPFGIAQTSDLLATLQRIQTFLDAEEFQRKNTYISPTTKPKVHLNEVKVTLKNKEVLKSVSVDIEQGLLLVTGNVGSGKSALLKTILGEYPVLGGQMMVNGSFSYATEEPWLFPSTIRQNILFGQRYDEGRYKEVLNVCALTYDINKFEKLDQTIVGDKGINLSKGQQARITLARAIYRDSDIYLLDDCLSSLDNHVNKHIFTECINGFLKDKICILVTNNVNNIRSMKNNNVLFLENGSTLTLEQQKGALDKRITYYIDEETDNYHKTVLQLKDIPENSELDDDDAQETDTLLMQYSDGSNEQKRNLYHEQNKEGGVLWSNYVRYYRFIGGAFVSFYLFVVFFSAQFAISYSDKLISMWVNLEPTMTELTIKNQTNTTEYIEGIKTREQYLNIYTILIVAGLILFILRSYSSFFFCMNGARKLHKAMVKAMLHAYMYFFDDHFIGNIINRLSKDFHTVDEYIPFLVLECYRLLFSIIGVFALVASVNWTFFIPATLLLVKFYIVQRFYLPTGRSLRRLEASTRSPIIGYINSALEGVSVARAAEQQDILREEFDKHQDLFTSAFYMNQTTLRFFTFVLDIFGVFFMLGIALKFVVFSEGVKAGDVGLAISQATMLSLLLQYAIRTITEVENVMTSVERVLEYTDVKCEPKTGKTISTCWPKQGHIKFKNVSLTYKSDGNRVLNNITFDIEAKSKIGIVGRTGAGKSSIISTLFRLYDFEGEILIDDENTKNLSLDFLRSNISIIPQDPVLFSGTLRTNVDPFNKYSDPNVWKALDEVQMKASIKMLNQPISESTSNFSSGQKQLLCLARAMVQGNQIIVLDEATANLDPETDQLLQKTVKEYFNHCTVITIAHRLNSVMSCDKVLVLDAGKIVEFDKPDVLLANSNGFLYKMVKEDGYAAVM